MSAEEAARQAEDVVTHSKHEIHQSNGTLEDLKADASNFAQNTKNTHGLEVHTEFRLGAPEPVQLLSPSPSPSPRSFPPPTSSQDLQQQTLPSENLESFQNPRNYSESPLQAQELQVDPHHARPSTKSPVLSKPLSPSNLHDLTKENAPTTRKRSASTAKAHGEVLKLSAADMEALTSAPESLPVTSPSRPHQSQPSLAASPVFESEVTLTPINTLHVVNHRKDFAHKSPSEPSRKPFIPDTDRQSTSETISTPINEVNRRPVYSSRSISAMPPVSNRMTSYQKSTPRQVSPRRRPAPNGQRPEPLDLNVSSKPNPQSSSVEPHSPVHIPLPPMSIPTYLQLELSTSRPSPLYIYRSANSDYPYESSKIKFERLLNFLLLPPQLEQVLYFGSLACLDAWLYTFTILPLRFFKALIVLISWWVEVLCRETKFILGFIYHGAGRFWHRQRESRDKPDSSDRSRSTSRARPPVSSTTSYRSRPERPVDHANGNSACESSNVEHERRHQSRQGWGRRHRRTKSVPSSLSAYHKADLLQGAVIVCSCIIRS